MRQCSSSRHSVALIIRIGNWASGIGHRALVKKNYFAPPASHLPTRTLPHSPNSPNLKILVIFYIGTVRETLKLIL